MKSNDPGLYVTLTLRDIDNTDPIPERTIVLRSPNWHVRIGRASLGGDGDLRPAKDNAWFDSRVISRNHAELLADPDSREIYIADVGSMHGTYLTGTRLDTDYNATLLAQDTLTFGADVIRGSSTFRALRVMVTWSWSDESPSDNAVTHPTLGIMYRNTFTADYSEEEIYDDSQSDMDQENDEDAQLYGQEGEADSDVEIVQDSLRDPSIEIIVPPRTFSVPESDISDLGSYASGEERFDGDTSTSSPVVPSDANEDKEVSYGDQAAQVQSPAPVIAPDNASHYSADFPVDDSEHDYFEDEESDDEPLSGSITSTPFVSVVIPPPEDSRPLQAEHPGTQLGPARTPSPSDAALAKPTFESFMAPPFIHHGPQPTFLNPVSAQSRLNTAWAGHNSVLYDPMPANNPAQLHPGTAYFPGYQPSGQFGSAPYDSGFAFYQPSPLMVPPQASRVSIAHIVDQVPSQESTESTGPSSLKRKADQISSELTPKGTLTSSEPNAMSPGENKLRAGATDAIGEDSSALQNNQHDQLASNVEAVVNESTQTMQMPPRKKARKSHATTEEKRATGNGGFIKMASVVAASMAIGVVGTIVGLAALPQDYFA